MSRFSHITRESVAAGYRSKLEKLREKVDIAEAGLRNARDQYEAEVERQGLPTRGIFSETFFVCRTSSDRWLAEAENEFNRRKAQDLKEMKADLAKLAAKKADDEEDQDDGGDDNEGDDSPHTPPDKKKSKKKAAPTDEDVEAGEAAAARFFRSRDSGAAAAVRDAETAAAIIAAGAKRRGEPTPRPAWERQGNHPKPSHLTVVPGAPPPTNPIAEAILRAGRKARGLED